MKQSFQLKQEDQDLWEELFTMARDFPFKSGKKWWLFKHQNRTNHYMFFGKLFSRFVDVYTLSRMLKNSLNSKIVVVFAGDSHIQFEQRFFEKSSEHFPCFEEDYDQRH